VKDERKHVKTAWVSKGKGNIVKKPWGFEETWPGFSGIHGKTLFIKAGTRTSLKYHQLKMEVLFIRSGRAEVTYGSEHSLEDSESDPMMTATLEHGDFLLVQSGCPYRISALENCEIIEIGNHLSDPPVRIDDDYGRKVKSDAIKMGEGNQNENT